MIQIKAATALSHQRIADSVVAEVDMSLLATLQPGTTVIATADFGPILCGQMGMVTGRRHWTWAPWRAPYSCTFLGGMVVTATCREIMPFDHGYSRRMLEDPWWFLRTREVLADRRILAGALHRPVRQAEPRR